MQRDAEDTVRFFINAIQHFELGDGTSNERGALRVLDFGCGAGDLVKEFLDQGFDAFGCDVEAYWLRKEGDVRTKDRCSVIERTDSYRLPFDDDSFDLIVSTSVMEHVQNTETAFRELHRVLRKGGMAMHIYPSKWYAPSEPHINVPFANWIWPARPYALFRLCSLLGIRNEHQKRAGYSSKEVACRNMNYMRDGVCYKTESYYKKLSFDVYGNYMQNSKFFLKNTDGGLSRLARNMPFLLWVSDVLTLFRIRFMVQRKL